MPSSEREDVFCLVSRYAKAAAAHGRATESGDYKAANRAYKLIATTYRELRHRGLEAQRALLPLLEDPDLGVRLWAGAHALEFAPADGEQVLSRIADIPKSFIAFSAKMTLDQWRSGVLHF